MKKILVILMMMAGMANAADIGIVVKDNTSRTTVGVDTLLGDFLAATLTKTVDYRDLDSLHTAAEWDAYGYDFVLFVGSNVSGAGAAWNLATAAADSVAKSNTPFICIGNQFWNEINLGTAAETETENTGYIINIGQSHWITKVLQDTISYWTITGTGGYNITIPDTLYEIDVLLLDKDSKVDTGAAILAVCDVGDTIINTGDARNISNQRRAFFGSWQYQEYSMDSCHFYTILARTAAWVYADTLNAGIMEQICFSGPYDLNWCSVVEVENATRSYGNYDSNLGYDSGEKQLFCKVDNGALQRAVGNIYRAIDVDSAKFSLRYKGTGWEGTVPDSFNQEIVFDPIIRRWQVERKTCYHSRTCPNASWTYAWMDTAGGVDTSATWQIGGAKGAADSRQLNYDSLHIDETSVIGTRYSIKVQPDTLAARMLDTTMNWGWVSRTIRYNRYPEYGNDYGEPAFTGPSDNNNRTPRFSIFLGTYSTSLPQPTIAVQYLDSAVTCDSIVFTGIVGQTIPTQYVKVINSAGGALECLSVTDNGAWLAHYESGTDTPITVSLSLTGTQTAGYGYATLTIGCADASNTPATIKVVRNLTAAGARTAGGAVIIK